MNRSLLIAFILSVLTAGTILAKGSDVHASVIFRTQNNLSLAQGLVGWWNFDGKTVSGTHVYDASGNGNRGVMTNGPTLVNGKLGQGIQFDGSNDYVDAGSGSSLNIDAGTFTLSAWIYPKSNPPDASNRIFDKRGVSGPGWNLALDQSLVQFQLNFVDGASYLSQANARSYNNWTHIALVYDGSNLTYYSNGVPWGSASYAGAPSSSLNLLIGDRNDNARSWFGALDDVRIYNRALSGDEIKRLYKIGATAKLGVAANNDSLTKGLVGWWNFDGKTIAGTHVYDASGNGNRGVMTNGPTLVNGKLGQALQFDEHNDYVEVPQSSSINVGDDFTVSFWMKTIDTCSSAACRGLVSKDIAGCGAGEQDWLITMVSGTVRFFTGGSSCGNLISVKTVNDGVWHAVAVTRNRTTGRKEMYIDGAPDDSNTHYTDSLTNTANLYLGANVAGGGLFPGLLDDVRIYNRALSADEIKRLYNMGR